MPTILNSFFSRIFRSRKRDGEDDKSTTSSSTPVSGCPASHRSLHRSKKQQSEDRRCHPPSFSSHSSRHSTLHSSEQHEHENLVQPGREYLEWEGSLPNYTICAEDDQMERKNSLEQELDEEEHFDWASLGSEVLEGLAEGAATHADRLPYNLPVNKSTPVLRRKSSARCLHDLYVESGPFRDVYVENTSLPQAPEPSLAFPGMQNTSPPDDRPTVSQLNSVFDMIFDVAKRSGNPTMDLENISNILSETATRLRRENGVRESSAEGTLRLESPVSPMSFASAISLLSHGSPYSGKAPEPESPVSPLSRGSHPNLISQRRLSQPETPVSHLTSYSPVRSLSSNPPSKRRQPIPETPIKPISHGSPPNATFHEPRFGGGNPRQETHISPPSGDPPTSPLPHEQLSSKIVPRVKKPVSPTACNSPVKPYPLGPFKPRKRLCTKLRSELREPLNGKPEPSDPWAMFLAVSQKTWQ